MSDDADCTATPRSSLPLTIDDLRRLNDDSFHDATRQALLGQLERLPPDRRDGVIALMDMLLALRAIPQQHHEAVHAVLASFNRLADDQRAAYLRLRPSGNGAQQSEQP